MAQAKTETQDNGEMPAKNTNKSDAPKTPKSVLKRELSTSDIMEIVGMLGASLDDPKLDNVPPDATQGRWATAIAGAFLSNSRRQFELLCASLIGVTEKYDFKDYKEKAKAAAREEAEDDAKYLQNENIKANWRMYMDSDVEIRESMNDDILAEWGKTKPSTLTAIVNEVRNDPNFTELWSSVTELMSEAGISFGGTETSSESDGDTSPSETS